jgi:hypothetical protein
LSKLASIIDSNEKLTPSQKSAHKAMVAKFINGENVSSLAELQHIANFMNSSFKVMKNGKVFELINPESHAKAMTMEYCSTGTCGSGAKAHNKAGKVRLSVLGLMVRSMVSMKHCLKL